MRSESSGHESESTEGCEDTEQGPRKRMRRKEDCCGDLATGCSYCVACESSQARNLKFREWQWICYPRVAKRTRAESPATVAVGMMKRGQRRSLSSLTNRPPSQVGLPWLRLAWVPFVLRGLIASFASPEFYFGGRHDAFPSGILRLQSPDDENTSYPKISSVQKR